jgi:hypothetical protein
VKLWEENLVRFTIDHAAAKLSIMRGTATQQEHERQGNELFISYKKNLKSLSVQYFVTCDAA